MPLASRPRTAASRRSPLLVLALVGTLVVLGWVSAAGAQEGPPPTDPTTTTPPTDPPPTDPPPTSPPPTDPPPTSPPPPTDPPTSGPGAPTPVTPAPPTTAAPDRSAPAPPTTARRTTDTTQRRGTPTEPAVPEADETTPPSDVAEDDPVVDPGPQPVATGERQPLLVAPTTMPGSPALALVDAAPAASSKALPLAIIVAIGVGGLALVLRPGRSSAPDDPDAASPVLLAGPSIVVPRLRPRAPESPAPAPEPPAPAPEPSGPEPPTSPTGHPTSTPAPPTSAPEPPASPIGPLLPADAGAPSGEPGSEAPESDLPAVADLVAEARRGRQGAAPPDRR